MSVPVIISVFDCPNTNTLKNTIWDKFSQTCFEGDVISFQEDCSRISVSQRVPKPITLYLGEQTLYYFKKKVPIGMLSLNFVIMVTKTYDGQTIFRLTRNQRVVDLLVNDVANFQQLLSSRCILTTFHDQYQVEKKIGIGNQALVYQAVKKSTDQRFAIKTFNKHELKGQSKQKLDNEIKVMRGLKQENLLHLYEVHETQNTVYFVMDLLQGGDLQTRMSKAVYSDEKLQQFMSNLLKAILYMHSKRYMHRDIKPQNILLKSKEDDVDIVLADFGLAMQINEPPIFKRCGTPGFVAPEVLHYEKLKEFYNEKCDIFSAGVIFYMLVTGQSPFRGPNQEYILEQNTKCKINFEIKQIIKAPKALRSLLKKMLRTSPQSRYSAEKCLNHEYFTGTKPLKTIQQKEASIVQLFQQVIDKDEEDDQNYQLTTQEPQWNGQADTVGSLPAFSPGQQQMKASLSKFGQFCAAMEALHQEKATKKKKEDSLYKQTLKNANQKGVKDDSAVQQQEAQQDKPKGRFLKKANSLQV